MFFLRTKQVSFTWMARSTTRHLWRTTGPPLRGSDSICVDEHLLSFTLFHADLVTCAGRVLSRGRQAAGGSSRSRNFTQSLVSTMYVLCCENKD